MAEIVQNVVNEAAAAARAAAEAARSMEAMMKQRDDKPRFAEAGKAESGRSKQLYSILAGLLKGRPLRILRSVTDRNGLEVWRQLNIQFAPRTKGRAISILSAYMNYPQFDKNKSFLENIQLLERVRGEYRKASNVELADDIQLSVLVRCLPRHVQQHVQLQMMMKEESTYAEVRAAVLAYENVTQSWTNKRIFNELGVVQSYAAGSGGSAPMEIDAVQWKGKDGGKQKGKGKDFQKGKGFGKFFNTKGKGKGKSDSKGGHVGKGKGWNQQPNTQKFDGYCDYYHKYGHKQKDCFIKKRDQGKSSGKGGNVRQVEEAADDTRSQSTSATAYRTPSVAASSTANTSKPSVKLLTQVNDELESWGDYNIEFDLTSFGQTDGAVQMVEFRGINDDADSELPGWNRIHDQMYVLRCNAPQFQDSTLAPSPTEMMWYRTTLALCEGVWNVLEDGVDVTDIDDLNAPILDFGVTEAITIAHNQSVDYKFLGFDEIDDESGGGEQQQPGGPSSRSGAVPVPMDDSLPAADDEAEQPPAEREELSDPLSVTVEGDSTIDGMLKSAVVWSLDLGVSVWLHLVLNWSMQSVWLNQRMGPSFGEAASDPPSPQEIQEQEIPEFPSMAGQPAQAGQTVIDGRDTELFDDDEELTPAGPPNPAPAKQLKIDALSSYNVLSLFGMEHEDEPNATWFEEDDIDMMEEYYMLEDESECPNFGALREDGEISTADFEANIDKLRKPFSKHEPELTNDELAELDVLADQVEIGRLKSMGVLVQVEDLQLAPGQKPKELSTKFVCTWRDSQGQSSLVKAQETPTVVTCISSNGATEKFGLGRVLPGQRDGSLLWYKDITRVLQEQLQIEAFAASPCLLRSPGMEVLILLHVDDMLLVGDKDFLEGLYKLSIEKMFHAGDEVCFLKRRHVMLSESEMVIYPHNKHFDKLFELLRIRKSWKPKNTPCHGQINEIDETEELDQDNASRFRSGVGVLLYLSHDLIECQFCIRCLARYMSKPTQRSMDILKHLVCYLLGRVEYGLLLSLHELDRTSEGITLFVYSDSDWAGHRGTRKSGSSCCIQADGVTLHAAARTQGLIALSSAEAETYASVSSACDAIFMKRVLEFTLQIDIILKLLIDNSAARQVLSGSGVGKIRHLSLKVLWLQSRVESKLISISPVASAENLADIGTKRLAVHTMNFLMHGIGIYDGNERVGEFENTNYLQNKTLKLLSKSNAGVNSNVMTLTLLSSLLGNALGCDVVAMESGPVVAGWTLTDYAFGVVELYVWQLIVLLAVVVGSFTWMVFELNGYKASLKSWRGLTDDLADDEEEKRKDAYARYLRWKRQKDAQRRWIPTIFAGVFEQSLHGGGVISSDGGTNVSTESSTQTDDLEAMEASADDHLEADLEDMNAQRRRAIDAITRRIDAAYVSGASQEELWALEDALDRVYML
eukprot:symbB.v1.2.036227.t1/scaffold5065.1/size52819/1